MRREYRPVYDYKGYTITTGNGEWIPDYETAKKVLEARKAKPIFKDHVLYLQIRDTEEPIDIKPNGIYEGKTVYNPTTLWWDAMRPGDYINEEVAENILDALPPACMRRDCLQLGEPHNHKTDEEGKVRATYLTLKKINDNVFEFCGYCFRGENTERGTEITYV